MAQLDDDIARHEIARLEGQIEALSESRERCRKISFAAKIAFAGGAAWFALVLLGILPFNPTGLVAALAAALGGVVLLGSNTTTWEQTEAALRQAEAARAELIGGIELRLVAEPKPTLH
jgi:hypothetical protein